MNSKRAIASIAAIALVSAILIAGRPGGDTYSVTARSLSRTAEFRGQLEAEDSLVFGPPAIRSQWNFKISYMAAEGQDIQAGEPLIGFDTTELQVRLLEAMSGLETAKATLEKRQTSTNLEQEDRDLSLAEAEAAAKKARLKAQAPKDLMASRDLEQARIDLATAEQKMIYLRTKTVAQAEVAQRDLENLTIQTRQKQAMVKELQKEIASLLILAPSEGTVVYETNWRREKNEVGDLVNRWRKVVSLPNLDRLRASAQIDEIFAAEIEVGQRVIFTMDSFPDDQFEGTIRSINPAIQQRSWRDPRKALRVDIRLTNPDPQRMRPGMRIQGDLEILRTEEVATLPIDTLVWQDGKAVVKVRGWFGTKTIAPKLGRRDEQWVEVVEGLKVGDQVLIPEKAFS